MAKIFNEGDEVTKEWLNGVSKTVTDGLGDNVAPATIRTHINAEQAGAASTVQGNLDSHKADSNLHFPDAPNDTKDYVRGQGTWKITALTEAPLDSETYGRRNGAWSVVSGTGQTDHQTLLNRSAVDSHPAAAITGLSEKHSTYDAHLANILNPHMVTAAQVGADPAGSASTVQGNLTTHEGATNPHNVTAEDVTADPAGSAAAVAADLTAHEADELNPHNVTAVQAGADPTGSAAAVQGNLDTHESTTHLGDAPSDTQYYGRKDAGWAIIPGTGTGVDPSDHSQLLNRDAVDAHPQSAITGLSAKISTYDGHVASSTNPHGVTAAQAGADTAGSAAGVQSNLNTHTAATNPHSVTAVQVGADPTGSASAVQSNLTTHEGADNPHGITAAGIGADPAGSAATVAGNLSTHEADTAAHIGHATSDANAYVSIDGAWGLLNDNITLPPAETDHTQMTNRDQPDQHAIGSIGISGGIQLQDEIDRIDAEVALKATSAALVAHGGDTNIHYADVPAADGIEYVRKNRAWVESSVVPGTGDLKSDGSVPMSGAYVPALDQDIATKASSEAAAAASTSAHKAEADAHDYTKITNVDKVFTDRLAGFNTNGALIGDESAGITDADTVTKNSEYYVYPGRVTNLPAELPAIARWVLKTRDIGSSYGYQELDPSDEAVGFNAGTWRRSREAGVWGAWSRPMGTVLTQDEYNERTPDADTLYFIVG